LSFTTFVLVDVKNQLKVKLCVVVADDLSMETICRGSLWTQDGSYDHSWDIGIDWSGPI